MMMTVKATITTAESLPGFSPSFPTGLRFRRLRPALSSSLKLLCSNLRIAPTSSTQRKREAVFGEKILINQKDVERLWYHLTHLLLRVQINPGPQQGVSARRSSANPMILPIIGGVNKRSLGGNSGAFFMLSTPPT